MNDTATFTNLNLRGFSIFINRLGQVVTNFYLLA